MSDEGARGPSAAPVEPAFPVEAAIDALGRATLAIAGELDLDRVLQLIVDNVRDLVQARYAALGIVDAHGSIERFITSGLTLEERAAIGPLPRGRGLLGLITREARAYRIADIGHHPDATGFPANHPPMRSFLGLPIRSSGEVVGNVYLTDKIAARDFSAADQRLVELFALHAGIAIQNARLHARVQRLAVVDQRLRIGRELHDRIIQGLYAVALSLEDVPELMTEAPAEAAVRVDKAIDRLGATIAEVRTFIMDLGVAEAEASPTRPSNQGSNPTLPDSAAPTPFRLLIVDDHEVVRQGLVALLSRREAFQVVAEAGTVAEAVEQALRFRPDIVIMDVRLPDGTGVEACREIRAELPDTRVVMLTSYPDEEAVLSAIIAGASGYLLKQIRARDLVSALEAVGRGESLLDSAVTEKVLERVRRIASGTYTDELSALTSQERKILLIVAEGKTNKEIAAEVFLSDKTVKNYVSSILSKLNLERRAQAAAFVAKHHLDSGGG